MAIAPHTRPHAPRKASLTLVMCGLISVAYGARAPAALSAPLTLSGLLDCARRSNPAHEVARAQALEAAAQLKGANLSLLPTLSLSGGAAPLPARRLLQYCVNNDRVIVCPNQEINDDQRLDQVEGMGIFVRTQVTLTQPLYTFGKISNGREAAEAGSRAYEAGAAYAERALDVMAFEAYHGLQLSAQVEAVFRRGREELSKFKRRVQKSLDDERGEYSSNDIRRLVIQEADLTARELEAQALKAQALAGVRVACELPPDAEVVLAEQRLSPYAAPPPPP